jgi:hypothetical protein
MRHATYTNSRWHAVRDGKPEPYYEYRDTAMSALGPFKPEWILELRRGHCTALSGPHCKRNLAQSLAALLRRNPAFAFARRCAMARSRVTRRRVSSPSRFSPLGNGRCRPTGAAL